MILEIVLTVIALLLLLAIYLLVLVLRRSQPVDLRPLESGLESQAQQLLGELQRGESRLKQELDAGRESGQRGARDLREELGRRIKEEANTQIKTLAALSEAQKQQLDVFRTQLERLTETNEKKLDGLRAVVETRLKDLQEDNGRKLDQMRRTVDEQLQGTLEKKLGESFKSVQQSMDHMNRSVGEMQTLAAGVGDLKRVLTNVKTRGIWGEIQLGSLLEQVLTESQYQKSAQTKPTSPERVDFVIRLPGKDDSQEVLLPIDAKFPQEDYLRLVDASEKGDPALIEAASRDLEYQIREEARSIKDKYLNPPLTTDFAIMYLPTEGLYAEVIRRPGLAQQLQSNFRVVLAGPTTLNALLNALQMGFQTLAIQKRSGEVWALLEAIKTEFGKFGGVLLKVKEKLDQASRTLDSDVQVRTRAIERKLRGVKELTGTATPELLLEPLGIDSDGLDSEDGDSEGLGAPAARGEGE